MNALCNKPFQDGGGDTTYTGATVKDGKVCVFTQIQVMGRVYAYTSEKIILSEGSQRSVEYALKGYQILLDNHGARTEIEDAFSFYLRALKYNGEYSRLKSHLME